MEIMNTPKYASKAFSGKLNISVTCIRDIDHIASPTFSKRPESVVSIKIDDVERAKTRGTRSGKWNEEFHIDIDKGNEIEFSVYDKSGSVLVPVAVTWALLSDISEEIRKKKVAQEVGSEGWVLASNLPNNNSKQHNDNYPSGSEFGATSNTTSTFNGSPKNYNSNIPSNMDSPVSGETKQVQINTWLSLEPVGQVLVSVSLDKSNQAGNKQFLLLANKYAIYLSVFVDHTFTTQPLTFRDECNTITFLMHRNITTIAKYYSVRVITVTVVADRTFLFYHRPYHNPIIVTVFVIIQPFV